MRFSISFNAWPAGMIIHQLRFALKQHGGWMITSLACAILIISAASAEMSVKSHHVRPGGNALFTINITNTGETPLDPIEVIDTLPKGMSYVSDDRNPSGLSKSNKVIWPNVGLLDVGESTPIHLITKIDPTATDRLTNRVSVTGSPVPEGYNVTSFDEEYVDPMSIRGPRNRGLIKMGDQSAVALGGGISANNIKISSN